MNISNLIKENKKKEKGFTLVESLIAITILMISVAAPLNLAGKGLMAVALAQKQIVAFYLAQDAMEAIMNIKTTSRINNNNFLYDLRECKKDGSNEGCIINTTDLKVEGCESDAMCKGKGKLYINDNFFYITKETGTRDSGYSRYVSIEEISTSTPITEARVTVKVFWNMQGGVKDYTLTFNMTNW